MLFLTCAIFKRIENQHFMVKMSLHLSPGKLIFLYQLPLSLAPFSFNPIIHLVIGYHDCCGCTIVVEIWWWAVDLSLLFYARIIKPLCEQASARESVCVCVGEQGTITCVWKGNCLSVQERECVCMFYRKCVWQVGAKGCRYVCACVCVCEWVSDCVSVSIYIHVCVCGCRAEGG